MHDRLRKGYRRRRSVEPTARAGCFGMVAAGGLIAVIIGIIWWAVTHG